MGKTAYQNPKAERLNETIKNDYLYGYHPTTFKELEIKTAKAVKMYNQQKPHQSPGGLTPDQFERNKNLTKTNFKRSSLFRTVQFSCIELSHCQVVVVRRAHQALFDSS
ncbi:integrase core domain-containing protein [Algoriphagus terrigena]|uniref:integrase core domain-containing protein n=1 Tax=Algoriphagus terrigena TaxID=344884 RepID=UPI003CCB870E